MPRSASLCTTTSSTTRASLETTASSLRSPTYSAFLEQVTADGAGLRCTEHRATLQRHILLAQDHPIMAQGIEAGGHRGVFSPDGTDPALTTSVLVSLLVR